MTQRVYDKHEQLVREYDDNTIWGRVFILPIRLPFRATAFGDFDSLYKQYGGRVEFERDSTGDWIEMRRKYESWYHNPWTGETWGRKIDEPEGYQDEKLEWGYE